jgi:predicted DNA-binding transcriptional regulator AlpA
VEPEILDIDDNAGRAERQHRADVIDRWGQLLEYHRYASQADQAYRVDSLDGLTRILDTQHVTNDLLRKITELLGELTRPEPATEPAGKLLLSEKECSELLGVSPSTLRNWRTSYMSNGPKFIKEGARVFYPRSEIHEWIRTAATHAEPYPPSRYGNSVKLGEDTRKVKPIKQNCPGSGQVAHQTVLVGGIERAVCPVCGDKGLGMNKNNKVSAHKRVAPVDDVCPGSYHEPARRLDSGRGICGTCNDNVGTTAAGKLRKHKNPFVR